MKYRKKKEKKSVSKYAKEKIQVAPKELLRRGLLTGAEKLQGQLRDAAQGGQREDTEADRAQAAARTATQWAVHRLKKLTQGKKKVWSEKSKPHADVSSYPSDDPAPNFPAEQTVAQDATEPVRIKTREFVHRPPPVEHSQPGSPKSEPPQIKTRDAYTNPQATAPACDSTIRNTIQPERQIPYSSEPGRQKFVRERAKNVSVRQTEGQRNPNQVLSAPAKEFQHNGTYSQASSPTSFTPVSAPASESDRQPPNSLEQGRQKFVQERQKKAAVRRREELCGPKRDAPIQQINDKSAQPGRISTPSVQKETVSTSNPVRGTVFSSKRQIKETRTGTKAVGRASRQTVKAADSSRQAAQAGGHSARTVQQTARPAVQARQRAVQAAGAAKRTAAAMDKPVVKAAASALRGAVSAIRASLAPLAAGGGAVIAIVLVLCLVGALLMSPLGIFFSGEETGGQTISSVVREINQEYDARVEELKAATPHDELSLSGSRATWPEILAVYAVKTVTDPTNGQEVITMDDEKKERLKQVFWDMNELSSFTSTVPGEGDDEEDTTTLHITVTAKIANEMADIYGFNTDQRQQLVELLSDKYRELWNAILGEIVAVALSQVGNVGGQPYWSWYGFGSRVDWCAIFVSWCANECGYIDAGVIPKFAGCVQGSRWFKDRGLWQDRSYTPNPGDIIFFDWNDPGGFSGPQDGVPDHVGIVERVENGRVYTVEGNSGDKCCQRSYPVGYYEIYGYGMLCP